MQPKLILLNGNPGMGKTTLAKRYAEDHPLALNLDIDDIWHMMGRWQSEIATSHRLKLQHAYALAGGHLQAGYDVIVPNVMEDSEQYDAFGRIAAVNRALFKEVVLLTTRDEAVERCKARARRQGYPEGFRPGGVLDSQGRERRLEAMYGNILATVALREATIRIEPVLGDIDGTYQRLLAAVAE